MSESGEAAIESLNPPYPEPADRTDRGKQTSPQTVTAPRRAGIQEPVPVRARNGSWTLKVRAEDGSERAFHSLYNPEAEARAIVGSFEFDGRGVLVVLGLGLGYHVAELADRYPRAQIVVVEADSKTASLCQKLGRSPKPQVTVISGRPADEALAWILRLQLRSGMQPLAVFPLASALAAFPSYYQSLLPSLERSARLRLRDKLKYPKFLTDEARIAVVDFGYYLVREIERALQRLGHQVFLLPLKKGQEGEQAVCILMEMMSRHRPDFLLTVNHLGFDQQGILTAFLDSVELPAASWYVDNPNLIIKGYDANVSPHVSMFVWDRGYLADMKSMGFEHVHYLPLATDDEVFKPLEIAPSDRRMYGAEIAFVGNSMLEPVAQWIQKVPPGLHPLVEELARMLGTKRMPVTSALRLSGDSRELDHLSEAERLDFEGAVLWRATLLYRLSCVKHLAEFRHRIHGDEGWKDLLGDGYRLFPRLSYYTEVPKLYNACGINLNATNLQMGSAVNQRVFDIPSCSALVLTDYQESLAELLEPGRECATYTEPGEIPEMARFYLRNPETARAIARNGRERVLREHTYRHRLERIVHSMRKTYGDRSR
ncbi:MAG: glycosyltransferase [Nitrososphaerales archaeon]|nr:glycosyltransferase [Nitrososphaerales archaeon]